MASGITTAFWGMTINNYDETSLTLVQNGYPDYCREIVHTLEIGKEGTPHIQAWIKLQRQQRLSFVKKLFPRGHFKPLTSDEYIANTKVYAQKLDDTAASAAVHRFNDPLHTIESVIKKVVGRMLYDDPQKVPDHKRRSELDRARFAIEHEMVMDDYRFAKIFVSATYKQMWKHFGFAMFENLWQTFEHTHTHTHTEEISSQSVDIPTIDGEADDVFEEEGPEDGSEGEDYQDSDGSEDGGYDSGGSSGDCSEDD